MFDQHKTQISDNSHYLKVFREIGIGMITMRLNLDDQVLKRKLRHVLGISIPPVRHIEAATDAILAWMSPDELLYFCAREEVLNRLNLLRDSFNSEHTLFLDVSDARAIFSMEGDRVREVVAKLAPIDTDLNSLALGEIRRTRFSQVAAAVWLSEENRAAVICFGSVEKYLSDLLLVSSKKGSEVAD